MRRWFAALPIRSKLIALALVVTSCALIAAIAGLVVVDVARFRTSAAEEAQGVAQMFAESIAGAIAFDDLDRSRQILDSVHVRPAISLTCVYRTDGTLFDTFVRDAPVLCPPSPSIVSGWSAVSGIADVIRNGNRLGVVYVERTLSDLRARIAVTAAAGGLMLLIAGVLALALAGRLQRAVSRPIVGLAAAARAVGSDQPYDLDSIAAPPDEVGELVQAFRTMVQRLLSSNEALRTELAERARLHRERETLLAREREASRLKDEFLAAVSHELRTPLNAILGWTQILSNAQPSPDMIEKAVASLSRNAQAQSRVIEDLLDVSRIITGKLQLKPARLDLRAVVESAIEVITPMAAAKNVRVETHLPGAPCLLNGDFDRLRQAVWNLLSNAVKFTPAEGRVTVTVVARGGSYAVDVSDTGIGIAPDFVAHVFERFRQADGSFSRQYGGLGLGLAIVKELTELHGGTVRAASAGPGQGAVFTLMLPAAAAGAALPAPPVGRDNLPRLDGMIALVVDDNADARDIVTVELSRAGATVEGADSGPDALERIRQQPIPHVVLCDLAMPGMDGYEVLRRIREMDRAAGRLTPVLALTAHTSDNDVARCLQAGFQGHLPKPLQIPQVLRAVADAAAREGRWPVLTPE